MEIDLFLIAKMLNISISEFIQFERKRITEFNDDKIKNTKYKYHYCSFDNLKDK